MSPRKLTENDKQEILEQYRNSQATTSTLAKSYEVSSSTISRFLKNKLSSTEYEDLIQQKRLARTPRGEKSSKTKDSNKKTQTKVKKQKTSSAETKQKEVEPVAIETPQENLETATTSQETAESTPISRRRRRRSTATTSDVDEPVAESVPDTIAGIEETAPQEATAEKAPNKLVLDKKVDRASKSDPSDQEKAKLEETSTPQSLNDAPGDNGTVAQRLILKTDRVEIESEDDEDDVDIITLKEMLGEDLEDFNDDDDDEDEDDWEEDEPLSSKSSSLSNVQILPLSQASFPRTCYLVIDRSAELIVKPLSDFADLGAIPQEENREKTLPVFDNHRIAKRFSNRRERIIKVPDGRILQKTSHYLQDKGITRLLIDGQIYSLIN